MPVKTKKNSQKKLTVNLLLKEKEGKGYEFYLSKNSLDIYLGNKADLTDHKLRTKVSEVDWANIEADDIEINANGLTEEQCEISYEMVTLKNYTFEKYKTDAKTIKQSKKPLKVNIRKSKNSKPLNLKSRDCVLDAVTFCRDIVSSNASDINPGEMERLAKKVASECKNIKVKVIDATQAKKLGMECLLAVGNECLQNNSKDYHPRLVILEYNPTSSSKSKDSQEHIAIVGKGITYDTGGLCLKPGRYMLDMKSDMGGSATVLSVFKAIASLHKANSKFKINKKITGVLGLAENGFGGSSYKPGDVLRARNGKTVQVVDTDAEGRLVLADAISYVSEQKPDLIVALATLTGSIVASLGEIAAGAMTNDQEKFDEVKKYFDQEGEQIWQMPIFDEYKKLLDSPIADIKHCSTRPDASLAAIFLREFVGEHPQTKKQIPWIHLDIAGTGFLENDGLWAYKGATGFAVKSLVNLIK